MELGGAPDGCRHVRRYGNDQIWLGGNTALQAGQIIARRLGRNYLDFGPGAPGAIASQLIERVGRGSLTVGGDADARPGRVRGRAWSARGEHEGQQEHKRAARHDSGRPDGRRADSPDRVDHEIPETIHLEFRRDLGVRRTQPARKVRHGHAGAKFSTRLDGDEGIDALHDLRINHPGDGAWIVYRRRVEACIAPVRLAKELHQLHGDAGSGRARRGDAFEHGGGGQRLVCQIQADHRQRPARREHNRGGLGVNGDIEFGRWRRIASGVGAAHENYFLDFLDDPRFFSYRHGNVRQRPGRHQGDVAAGTHQQLDDQVDGMTPVEGHGRLAERGAVEPGLAVNIRSRLQRPGQGPIATGRYRDIPYAGDATDPAGIEAGFVDGLVPSHGRDRDELDLRVAVSEQNRHGVIVAGIAIQNDLSSHLWLRE